MAGASVEHGRVERRWAAAQLLEMQPGEPAQHTRAGSSQAQSNQTMIVAVGSALDERGRLGPVDESDHAVVAEQEVVGHLADGRRAARVSAHREQQLVLRGRDAGVDRLLLAPVQELPELVAELEQPAILGLAHAPGRAAHEVYRTTICRGSGHRSRLGELPLGLSPTLLGLTLVVGIGGGIVGASYLLVIHLLQHVLAPDNFSSAALFLVLGAVGVLVVVLARALGNPGDVELLVDNIHVSGGAPSVRSLRSLVPMSAVTIAAGAAAGPEAPLVTTCGTLAGWLARIRRSTASETRCLTIAGMAAAFAVLFGAPIGAAFFALEILHRRGMQYHEALVPSLVGALSGFACSLLLTDAGAQPIWTIPSVDSLRATDLLWAAGAGVGGAVVAIVFTYLVLGSASPVPARPAHPPTGGRWDRARRARAVVALRAHVRRAADRLRAAAQSSRRARWWSRSSPSCSAPR